MQNAHDHFPAVYKVREHLLSYCSQHESICHSCLLTSNRKRSSGLLSSADTGISSSLATRVSLPSRHYP
jgi:hypothetical protein